MARVAVQADGGILHQWHNPNVHAGPGLRTSSRVRRASRVVCDCSLYDASHVDWLLFYWLQNDDGVINAVYEHQFDDGNGQFQGVKVLLSQWALLLLDVLLVATLANCTLLVVSQSTLAADGHNTRNNWHRPSFDELDDVGGAGRVELLLDCVLIERLLPTTDGDKAKCG